MSLNESILEKVSQDGEMDYSKWSSMVPAIVERLNHIAMKEFITPRPYPNVNPILSSQHQSMNTDHIPDPPTTLVSQTPNTPRTLPPVPPFPGSSTSNVPDSQSPPSSPLSIGGQTSTALPAELQYLLDGTTQSLLTTFANRPPHTIQRFAELILRPKKHYKYLPSWIRAVDRVISVSSSADIFPLSDTPPIINGVNGDGGGILWATSSMNTSDSRNGSHDRETLGSDESLGGALLTPIPWLKDTSHLNNGSYSGSGTLPSNSDSESSSENNTNNRIHGWQSSVESGDEDAFDDMLGEPIDPATVAADAVAIAQVAEAQDSDLIPGREDGAVTQGELIRMEQEAGIVVQPRRTGSPDSSDDSFGRTGGIDMDDDGEAMPPHARGPDVIGTVDMGLVGGKEREVRISSPPSDTDTLVVDPNDAQDVLAGSNSELSTSSSAENGGKIADKTRQQQLLASGTNLSNEIHHNEGTTTPTTSEGYVDVGKDEMQLDSNLKGAQSSSDDGDIVLVDADGVTEDDNSSAAKSGVNVGADSADTSTQ